MSTFALPTPDAPRTVTERPLTRASIALTALLGAVLIFDGFDMVVLGYLAPAVSGEFKIGRVAMGLVITVAHLGVMLGGVLGGLAGDRFGRRPMLLTSVAGFGAGTVLCALADSQSRFVLFRFLASICMGAASPNIATYLIEILPKRWAGRLSMFAYTAYALGGTLCGITAKIVLPSVGWRRVFEIGGFAPLLVLFPVLLWALPESPRFLFEARRSIQWRALFANHGGTVAGLAFLALLLYFASVAFNSMGTLMLTSLGLSTGDAVSALLANNIAGLVGSLASALGMHRFGSKKILVTWLASGALCVLVLAALTLDHGLPRMAIVVPFALCGFGVASSLMILFPLAAHAFPTEMRSSGTGAVTSIGRIGAMVSSTVVAMLMGAVGVAGTFLSLAAILIAAASVAFLIRRHIPAALERS